MGLCFYASILIVAEVSVIDPQYRTEVCKNKTRNSLKNDRKVLRRGQNMYKYKHELFYSTTFRVQTLSWERGEIHNRIITETQ